jgi:thiosulfate/3-mercaptopyruvate sulfurtransferase
MTDALSSPLITVEALASALGSPDVRVIDATWFAPWQQAPQTGAEHHNARRIPGAVFFDIDKVASPHPTSPHMAASPAGFASALRALGLGDGHRLVVYDANRGLAAPRVWWNLRLMGVHEVQVLDGGLAAWEAAGHQVVTGAAPQPTARHFTARRQGGLVKDIEQMRARVAGRVVILDARPQARFEGSSPEPRPGLPSGHMPGARCLPAPSLYRPDGRMLEPQALRQRFADVGVDPAQPFVATCGSGVTAAILLLAAAVLGYDQHSLYDGSWVEWAADPANPITAGPADG